MNGRAVVHYGNRLEMVHGLHAIEPWLPRPDVEQQRSEVCWDEALVHVHFRTRVCHATNEDNGVTLNICSYCPDLFQGEVSRMKAW